MSYQGIVCQITVREHFNPKFTKVKIGDVGGDMVVVGGDVLTGELGVFFGADGQLSHQMCMNNSLYRVDPTTNEKMGGYLEPNRRIRSLKLCEVKSAGLWLRLSSLAWTGYDVSNLKPGDPITQLNGHEVCSKYYTPATLAEMKKKANLPKKERKHHDDVPFFKKHFDTPQFRMIKNQFPVGSVMYITSKLHGTSGRTGNCKVITTHELPAWKRWVNKLIPNRFPVQTEKYQIVNGTRNVHLKTPEQVAFYESEGFRWKAIESWAHLLHKGETVYYELVGYTDNNKLIMQSVDTDVLNDPSFVEQYGKQMSYTYGCLPGQCKLFVYRITRTNEDGIVTELSFPQVQHRAAELGVEVVPLVREPFFLFKSTDLEGIVENASEGPESLDPRHIKEGVVVRAEGAQGTIWAKYKSWTFGVLEGYIKNNDSYVDMEEIS